MLVARWAGCGEGQALEGSLAGGTVWPRELPSAGERCVFSHTQPPLATAVWEGFSRTGKKGGQAETGSNAEATGWPCKILSRCCRTKTIDNSCTNAALCTWIPYMSTYEKCADVTIKQTHFRNEYSRYYKHKKISHDFWHNLFSVLTCSGFSHKCPRSPQQVEPRPKTV